jgi:uncharacterized protein YhbP (UPF0306 family)
MSTSQPEASLPDHVLAYLREQNTLTLATASLASVPRATTFLYVNDGPMLYFWAKSSSVSARHVEQNPTVSFTIDEYAPDLRQTRGVQGEGECSVLLDGVQIAQVADLFGQKFPSLSPGATLSISFFRIAPTELQFIDNTAQGGMATEGMFGADFHRERAYSVFTELPVQPSGSIAASLQKLEVPAGEIITRQGGPADKFFIVVQGSVELVREEDASAGPPTTLGPGSFFGEVAILRDKPRSATVRAVAPTTLLAMDRDMFRDLVAQSLSTTAEFDQIIRARLEALASAR